MESIIDRELSAIDLGHLGVIGFPMSFPNRSWVKGETASGGEMP